MKTAKWITEVGQQVIRQAEADIRKQLDDLSGMSEAEMDEYFAKMRQSDQARQKQESIHRLRVKIAAMQSELELLEKL